MQEMGFQTEFIVHFSVYWCLPVRMWQRKRKICIKSHLASSFIHLSANTLGTQASTSTKVSDCVLFPHDLPLILKQEYIISKIQFERRVVSAFCLSSAAMGRDWDGCECLVLFNSGWFSYNHLQPDTQKQIHNFGLLNLILVNIWEISWPAALTAE